MTTKIKIHNTNIYNLTLIIEFLNNFLIQKIPNSLQDIKQIYEAQFYIANTLIYIKKIINRNISLKKKKKITL